VKVHAKPKCENLRDTGSETGAPVPLKQRRHSNTICRYLSCARQLKSKQLRVPQDTKTKLRLFQYCFYQLRSLEPTCSCYGRLIWHLLVANVYWRNFRSVIYITETQNVRKTAFGRQFLLINLNQSASTTAFIFIVTLYKDTKTLGKSRR